MFQHPSVPWIGYEHHQQGGFVATDTRTGEQVFAPDERALHQFAADRAAKPGYLGAGDVVKKLTSALGIEQCTPCAAKQAAMNAAVPRVWWK